MKRAICANGRPVTSRRGAAIVFGLVTLLVASLLVAAVIKTAALSHRQLQRDELRVQANLLADAGCERVLAKLRQQPDFTGETWTVPAEQLGLGRTAAVKCQVSTDAAGADRRIVSVTAEYPVGSPDRCRVTREFAATAK
jgi:type II secretory pathway component PulK